MYRLLFSVFVVVVFSRWDEENFTFHENTSHMWILGSEPIIPGACLWIRAVDVESPAAAALRGWAGVEEACGQRAGRRILLVFRRARELVVGVAGTLLARLF